jgi:CHAD domain-containing protein
MLTPAETFWLRWHADSPESPARVIQLARTVLLAEAGGSPAAIAAELGISEAGAERALSQFERRRLSMFPRPALFPDELLAAAGADTPHARHVARLAAALFDHTRSMLRLPARLRDLLETAARLHEVCAPAGDKRPHWASREVLLNVDLVGYSSAQRDMIACAVGFHHKKVRPEEDPVFAALSPTHQRQTLALAALLRLAEALDDSRTQTTQLESVILTPEAVTLRLSGPKSGGDAARARRRADLWQTVFHLALDAATPPGDQIEPLAALTLAPDSILSDAARRAIATQLLTWQANEPGALTGDAGAIKKVRGAARRMRMALKVFEGHFKKKPVKRLRRGLRQMEAALGRVRDLDIVLADARGYQAEHPEAAPSLPVLEAWEKQRQAAMAETQAWLGGPGAAELQAALQQFVAAPPARQQAPIHAGFRELFDPLVAEVAERQAAAAPNDLKSHHRLRIAFKQCRFALEFLRPALPPPADDLIGDLIRMQDRLGAVNDRWLLVQRVDEFLRAWAEKQAKRKAPQLYGAQDVLIYQNARRVLLAQQLKQARAGLAPMRAARLRQRLNALARALQPALPSPAGEVAAPETPGGLPAPG